MGRIREQLEGVRASVAAALIRAGRGPREATLIAVSKNQPPRAIREAYDAGQRDFGENYAQELAAKARELADLTELRWHFIGHLQRNKVKDVVATASVVHTVDRISLAEELSKRADREIGVLLEVNIGGESQKAGVSLDGAAALARAVHALPRLCLRGLMTIPPASDDAESSRAYFSQLARLRTELSRELAESMVDLSMGMSHDFAVAIEEGATLVRVGTAIFGARAPKQAS